MNRFALLILIARVAVGTASAQTPEDLIVRLKDSNGVTRADALVALARVEPPSATYLEPIADRLLDEVETVRVTAAFSLASVAAGLGCDADVLLDCKLLSTVLDATPKKVKHVNPVYPDALKRERVQGSVRIAVLIRPDGSVGDVRAAGGSVSFHAPALEAIRRWEYKPATRNGVPVPFAFFVRMTFRLK